MSTIHSHHSFCNTWWVNEDNRQEALFRSVCSHYSGLEKGRGLWRLTSVQWHGNHTRKYQSCSCNPLILPQENHLAKKYVPAWNWLQQTTWVVGMEGGINTKSCPSEFTCKILITSRDQDFLPSTQLWECVFLKWLGEAQRSLSIAHYEINES